MDPIFGLSACIVCLALYCLLLSKRQLLLTKRINSLHRALLISESDPLGLFQKTFVEVERADGSVEVL